MARKKGGTKFGIGDIAAAWKAGWTPDQVNSILDRLDAIGDPNDPEEDEDLDDEEVDEVDEVDDSEDEDSDSPDEDEKDSPSDTDSKVKTKDKTQGKSELDLLKRENARLQKQLDKIQAKNRAKDVSGEGDQNKKTPEQSLIDAVQELF